MSVVRPQVRARLSILSWAFVLVMALSPILSACSPQPTPTVGAPQPLQPTASGRSALAAADQAPASPAANPVASAGQSGAAAASAASGTVAQPAPTPTPTPTRPPLPPTVLSVKPDRGEEQVLAAPVTITFDQPMEPASTSSAFAIEPKVPGEVKVQGNQLIFTPTERLKRGAEYRISVAANATSAAGIRLREAVSFKFVTAGFLEVTNVQPADGATDVPVDAALVVAFNRPVVPLGFTAGPPQGANNIAAAPLVITPTLAGKGEWINTSIYRFTPAQGLAASTGYTVTVRPGLEDTTGGLLIGPYTFGFRTTDPAVLEWLPRTPLGLRVESPISATFSMAMDRASTEAAFSLTSADGRPVPGAFTWAKGDTVLGFKPARMLDFGVNYVARVARSARPANGMGVLRSAAEQTFTTLPLPKVRATDPKNGELRASPGGGVRFDFVSPMNPATFITNSITILPKPTRVYTSYYEWDNSFYISFDKLPATAYTVTLSGKVGDSYGNLLGSDYVLNFTTRNYPAALQLSTHDRVGAYNAYTRTQALVTYRNLPEVTFGLYRSSVAEFIRLTGPDSWDAWDKFKPAAAVLLREWRVSTDAKLNQTASLAAELQDADGKPLKPGIYYLQIRGQATDASGGSGLLARQLLARTDLNITLKSATQEALAWVTDLKTGQPVADAAVRFTDGNEIDVQARTSADGVARASFAAARRPWEPLVAVATTPGGGFGVASSNWEEGINPWDFKLPGGASAESYNAYVYTDRPIYRPGQTVYWKALLRRDNDALYSLPAAGQPVTVTIADDQGNELLNQGMTLSPLGALDGEFALGPEAALGYYYISILLEDPARPEELLRFGVSFQVAEYRKPEYELSAQTFRPEYVQGEQISVTLQASYFFGGPVKDGKVNWVLLSNDYTFEYQGKDGPYSFGDWDWFDFDRQRPFGAVLSQGEGVTDANGQYIFVAPADITKYQQSQRFTFDITVLDVNNQPVSTQANAIVHKGAIYVGLRPERYVGVVGEPNRVSIITVDTQSRPVASTDVTAVVNRVTWYSVREQAEDGNFYWTSRAEKTPVYTETLTADVNGKALLAWTPDRGGEYKVEASARDKAGHTVRSAAFVWVSGKDYVSWRQENNDRIELIADKDEYQVGDTAQLLVASPYQGSVKALLSVERDHVLSYQVIELASNSEQLKLPIQSQHAPNIFVSLMLVKGMDEANPTPSFKMGLQQLKVSTADKALKLTLTPRRASSPGASAGGAPLQVGPRDKVIWDVQTLTAAGKPVSAEVSLALVDKAILTLAQDSAGTLMDRFYSQRALGVRTASTLVANVDRLVAQLMEGGKGGGGGAEAASGAEVRREFPDIAFWRASVTTGADGRAQLEVTLPDNVTTWTMDGRAITADTLVGQAMTDIIATKDLLVRPVLPRFLIEGDQVEIAAIVQNSTGQPLDVTIELTAAKLPSSKPARITATVPAQGAYKTSWPVSVFPGADQVTVLMSAAAVGRSALSDAVEITLPVYRYSTPEVVGTAGQVAQDEGRLELLRLPLNADPVRGELDVTLEPSLAAGMTGGLSYLEHYPYECIEQTMSRFLPNVVTYQALKKLGISRPDLDAVLPQQVGVGLQRVYARQHVDGGWGWWATDESNVAVSSYVVFGLAKARQAGFTVDKNVLDRAVRFLRRNLLAPGDLNKWELNSQAFLVYALAEAGAAEPNRAGALFEVRERLSLYAKGYLALALGLIADDAAPGRIKTLLADLGGKAVVTATTAHWEEGWTDYWNMNSDTRTTSIVLDALSRLDVKNSLGPNTVRWLMSARKADRWETTQENAWAIMALTDWMVATGELVADYSWQVLLNDVSLGQGAATPANVSRAITLAAQVGAEPGKPAVLPDQTNGLVIQRSKSANQTGKGQLYYTAYLKSYLPVEKVQPLSRGVSISRQFSLADCPEASAASRQPQALEASRETAAAPACPPVTEARVGDVINVRLNIVVPAQLSFVVVEDPLPAGAEAVDVSLATTSITARGPEVERVQAEKESGAAWWWDWWWTPTHTELRDEKVALFATTLAPGTYEFTYQIRASLPGRFLVLPPTAYQMYAPEVWGRGSGSVFTVK